MMFRLVRDLAAAGVPVAVACRVLGVSRSGFHAWSTRPPQRKRGRHRPALTARIEAHIDALAADGVPWPVIADALGVTRQAARQAYARRHTAA